MGLRVFSIVIGWYGKSLVDFDLFGCNIVIRSLLFGGFAYAAPKGQSILRLRQMVFIAAGPLVHVAFIGLAIELKSVTEAETWQYFCVDLILLTNIVMLGISLWPTRCDSPAGRVPNDGLWLWILLSGRGKELQAIYHPTYFELEALRLKKLGKFDEAKAILDEGLVAYPANERMKVASGGLHSLAGEHNQARTTYDELLQGSETLPEIKAVLMNNIAWSDLFIEGKLEEADRLSSQAFSMMPWLPGIKGTRGSVLVELGRIDEGVRFLKQALEQREEPDGKAWVASFLALAMLRQREIQVAIEYYQQAIQLDPSGPALKKLRKQGDVLEEVSYL